MNERLRQWRESTDPKEILAIARETLGDYYPNFAVQISAILGSAAVLSSSPKDTADELRRLLNFKVLEALSEHYKMEGKNGK